MSARAHGGDRRLLGRLLRQARPYWSSLSGVLVLDIVAMPLALLTPVPLMLAVDSVGDEPMPAILQAALPSALVSSCAFMLSVDHSRRRRPRPQTQR